MPDSDSSRSERGERAAAFTTLSVVLAAGLAGTVACGRGGEGGDTGAPSASGRASAAAPPSASAALAPSASASAARALEPEWTAEDDALQATIPEQREAMFGKMKKFLGLSEASLTEIRRLFATQRWMGQGNPKCTEHPMTRAECRSIRAKSKVAPGDEQRCGAKNMVPIYNRSAGETEKDAKACIDQFEFPNIACEYPVTWVPAHIAQGLCLAEGKRLCDAHEWEGACAGSVLPAEKEYAWYARKGEKVNDRRLGLEYLHNNNREIVWAYGPEKNHAKCATGSRKSDGCIVPTWEKCGTNTYPAGAFPECVSPFGVYDLHGNAAEHMNLPMAEDELASRGSKLGQTEMKGSWFIFGRYEAHIDDCRWRAPSWHGSAVMAKNSHMNYHLGFRCCRDLPPKEFVPVDADADAGADTGVADAGAADAPAVRSPGAKDAGAGTSQPPAGSASAESAGATVQDAGAH